MDTNEITSENTPQNIESMAKLAYERYCAAVGGKAFNGDRLPSWTAFASDAAKAVQANAWRDVAGWLLQLARDSTERATAHYSKEIARLHAALELGQRNCDAEYERLKMELDIYEIRVDSASAALTRAEIPAYGTFEERLQVLIKQRDALVERASRERQP